LLPIGKNCKCGRRSPKSIAQKKMDKPIIGKAGELENPGDAVPIARKSRYIGTVIKAIETITPREIKVR